MSIKAVASVLSVLFLASCAAQIAAPDASPINYGEMETFKTEVRQRSFSAFMPGEVIESSVKFTKPFAGIEIAYGYYEDGELKESDVGGIKDDDLAALFKQTCPAMTVVAKKADYIPGYYGQTRVDYALGEGCGGYCLAFHSKLGKHPIGGMHCTQEKSLNAHEKDTLGAIGSFRIR